MDASTSTAESELVVTRVIDAPRRLVFKAWTQPEHIARWWGPQGFTTIHCDMDIRVGGTYRFGMRSPQGTEHWKRGVYREIVEPERIVFTFAWEDAERRAGPRTAHHRDLRRGWCEDQAHAAPGRVRDDRAPR